MSIEQAMEEKRQIGTNAYSAWFQDINRRDGNMLSVMTFGGFSCVN